MSPLPDLDPLISTDFSDPLLAEYDANLHLTRVYLFPEGLGLVHEMKIPEKVHHTLIPWEVLFAGPPRQGVNHFYPTTNLTPFQNPKERTDVSFDLPDGHTLVDVDVVGGFCLIATTSDQGWVDGELLLKFNTIQVYLFRDGTA